MVVNVTLMRHKINQCLLSSRAFFSYADFAKERSKKRFGPIMQPALACLTQQDGTIYLQFLWNIGPCHAGGSQKWTIILEGDIISCH